MRTAASRFAAFALLTLALAASCDRTPTTPSTRVRPDEPPQPVQVITTKIELIAPRTLAPGATAQLSLLAHRSNGTTQDVTTRASFSCEPADFLVVSPDGIPTALRIGDARVFARFESLSATGEIVVAPEGTYRVYGQVTEEDTPTMGISTVRIEVDGIAPVITDWLGYYRFYTVPGAARMRLSKAGYITKELTLDLADHRIENVALATVAPRVDLSGTYELTLEAPSQCRGLIPEPLLTGPDPIRWTG